MWGLRGQNYIGVFSWWIWPESSLGVFWKAKAAKFLHADNKESNQIVRTRSWFESPLGEQIKRYVFSGNDAYFSDKTGCTYDLQED